MDKRTPLTIDYSISRVLKGHWQLSSGHLVNGSVDSAQAVHDMHAFVEAGITTFDVADIYTGAEELIGKFLKDKPSATVQIHTKYVPDMNILETVSFDQTAAIIERSLQRLGVEALDLVQFHWWDYNVPRYVEVAHHLQTLKEQGKVKNIGVTNFDAARLQSIVDSGVNVSTAQVQYSILDRRPENGFIQFCSERDIHILCYGTIAGGFIGNQWMGRASPLNSPLENRSLAKYSLIIDEIGGWNKFQNLLQQFDKVAGNYGLTISEIAAGYILTRAQVAGVIIGSHNSNHLGRISRLLDTNIKAEDVCLLEAAVDSMPKVPGDIYDLERNDPKHKGVMKVNLNSAEHH